MQASNVITDWWITPHAARKMVERGFTIRQLKDAAEFYENSWDSDSGYKVRQRGDVAVVVDAPRREIVTCLLRTTELWGDQKVTIIEGTRDDR